MQEITNEIIVKASEGDVPSFEIIYKEYSRFVYNVSLRVVTNRDDAQEITQEVFITLYRKLKSFRFESSFKTWVYRIAINSAINYAKKVLKGKNKMVEYNEELNLVGEPPKIEQISEKEDKEERINKLLSVLNPDQRTIVILRTIEDLSYQEIAKVLKININTVRSRLKRAREALLAIKKEVVANEL